MTISIKKPGETSKNIPMSAYEIAYQLYGDESFASFAAAETRRAGWKFAGYDDNGDEVYTP